MVRRPGSFLGPGGLFSRYNQARFVGAAQRWWNNSSGTRTNRRRNATTGRGVTDHFDRKLIYRRKRMPKYRRRRWKRFVGKVKAVNNKDLGTKSYVFNDANTSAAPSGTTQGFISLHLYGLDADISVATGVGNGDIYQILKQIYGTLTAIRSKKIIVRSAILDITFENTTSPADGDSGGIEVDLYEISIKKPWGKYNTGVSYDALIQNVMGDAVTTGSLTAFSLNNRGTTPFNAPIAMQYMKVWKKVKFFLSVGHTATYQVRLARDRVIEGDIFQSIHDLESPMLLPGWSRGLLLIHKPTPGNSSSTTSRIVVGSTRTYTCAIDSNEQIEAGWTS